MEELSKNGTNIYRPLLKVSKSELVDYAKQNSLEWIEDPSNQDDSYDRNYIRSKVLPIFNRFPNFSKVLNQVMDLQKESTILNEDLAKIDMVDFNDIKKIQKLSDIRIKNVLKYLAKAKGKAPTKGQLEDFIRVIKYLTNDKKARLVVGNLVFTQEKGTLKCE
jgi:tRNA(Ile)-lysidine synthase